MSSPTISVRTFKFHLQRYIALGNEMEDELLTEIVGKPIAQFDNDDDRIPLSSVAKLSHEISLRSQDPLYALEHCTGQHPNFMHNSEPVVKVASSLIDFIDLVSRYLCLTTEIGSFQWLRGTSANGLFIRFNPVVTEPEALSYHQLDGAMLMLKEAISKRYGLNPTHIRLGHKCPTPFAESKESELDLVLRYENYFKAPVAFDHLYCELVYEQENLFTPALVTPPKEDTTHPNLESLSVLAKVEREKQFHNNSSLSDSVSFLLQRQLPRGETSREAMANLLFISVRTLQRKLGDEGTTFQSLLEETRKNLAEAYLKLPNISHIDIAFWLGYTEASQYYRAFKRWFGVSAKDYSPPAKTA